MTKSSYFQPTMTLYSAREYANLHIHELVRLHGVLLSIILNRGIQFTFHFWRSFKKGLGTNMKLSTTFHPQIYGQVKRTI